MLGSTYIKQLAGNPDLKTIPAENLLKAAVPLLKKARANYLILLAQTTHKEAIDLAKKYPDFDLVICAGRRRRAAKRGRGDRARAARN